MGAPASQPALADKASRSLFAGRCRQTAALGALQAGRRQAGTHPPVGLFLGGGGGGHAAKGAGLANPGLDASRTGVRESPSRGRKFCRHSP